MTSKHKRLESETTDKAFERFDWLNFFLPSTSFLYSSISERSRKFLISVSYRAFPKNICFTPRMTAGIRDPHYGLCWKSSFLGHHSDWSVELDEAKIGILAQRVLFPNDANGTCEINFFAKGTFNKLYKVEIVGYTYLLRIPLPVEPRAKTASEVATIKEVRALSNVPVPNIRAFSDSNDNEIGFEWILMDLIPGSPLDVCWRKLDMNRKESLTRNVAQFMQSFSVRNGRRLAHWVVARVGAIYLLTVIFPAYSQIPKQPPERRRRRLSSKIRPI